MTYVGAHASTRAHTHIHKYYMFKDASKRHTNSTHYRVARTHRITYSYKLFFSKEPYTWWRFCGRRPAN